MAKPNSRSFCNSTFDMSSFYKLIEPSYLRENPRISVYAFTLRQVSLQLYIYLKAFVSFCSTKLNQILSFISSRRMVFNDTKEFMPWVGLYIAGASLVCILAMAVDAFQGIRQWKLWFPNKFFALNTVSISLIAIAMKLPVDLSTDKDSESITKAVSIDFLVIMLVNFVPSLGLMDDKELLVKMIAWGILLITIAVNVLIQIIAVKINPLEFYVLIFPLLLVFPIALIVPASRRILEHKYNELHKLATYPQDIKFSSEELEHNVKKYWMMAETGNPQFLIACLEISSAFGVICSVYVVVLFFLLLSSCWYLCKLLIGNEKQANVSHVNVRSELEEYTGYVLQIEDDVNLSKRVQKNTLNSITRLLHASEKEKPKNLIKLLTKSKGFSGVLKFDNDNVRPLYLEEAQNSWSLVVVTLTTIAIALPNIAKDNIKGLLVSTTEGLEFVKHIEESLNVNEELVKARKASKCVGIEVELYRTWQQSDLKKMARKGKTSKEILQWLGDRAATIVESKSNKDGGRDYSDENVLAANSMYRISRTIQIHCNEQEEWPTDEEVFEWVSKIIADIFLACFTNLPRVITMKCHHDAIEKRQDSIRTAARILGKSKVIMNILKGRQLPNIDMDSMAYLDKWHTLPKSHIPEDSPSLNESLELTIM
ncbi:hypothetical protein CTI12_AA314130 [Artemisia annua]|uniref:Uncharacterized protein n=1 Tax=Artemisia annua TaxID=35608 RepID=A0A2U1N2W3_ARTAN|nr:hypothetical protein CTI12_AA314130 [Artemisia annua]